MQRSRRASSRPKSWSADLAGELELPAGTRERYRFSLWEPRNGEPGWESLAAAYVAARRLALGYLTFGPMLTLVGEPGVGKTHLALAVAWEWVERFEREPWAYLSTGDIRAQLEHKLEERRKYRWSLNDYRWWRLKYPEDPGVRFARAGELLDRLRRGYEDGAYYSLLEECQRCRLLVLDDLGHQQDTPWGVERLDRIIDARYLAGLPTVVTTNAVGEELPPRIASRLRDRSRGYVGVIKARDYRRKTRRRGPWTT